MLGNNQIKAIPSAAVFNFPLATSVSILFDSNKIRSIQGNAFSFIPKKLDLVNVDLSRNGLTTIPCGAFSFPLPKSIFVNLAHNKITTVPSCAFNFPTSKIIYIQLQNNSITTISSEAFNFPSGTYTELFLGNNQISFILPNTFSQGKIPILVFRILKFMILLNTSSKYIVKLCLKLQVPTT